MTFYMILWLSVIWIPILMYFMLANETKFKKNLAVGVTFPQRAREDEELVMTLKSFKRAELAVCLALIALGGVCMAVPTLRESYVLWLVWLDVTMVAPFVAYAVYNTKLKALKRRKEWGVPTLRTASISVASLEQKWLSPLWFAPAVVLAVLPAVFDRWMWLLGMVDGVTAALCFFGYRYLYRNRAEAVDENDALTQALTRVRRRAWGQLWLLCAWLMAAVSLWIWLGPMVFAGARWLETSGLLVFTFGVAVFAISVEFRVRHVQERLTAGSGTDFYVDEDDKWIWGQIYYNPDDSRTIVNNRVGVNSTVNAARPVGKLLLAVTVLLLLAMPLLGVWMEDMGSSPVTLTVEGETLVAGHSRTRYEIALDEIDQVELMDALPAMTRVNGTGMDSVLKGKFTSPDGRATVCLDPRMGPWLRIVTTDGTLWYLGATETGSAEAVYGMLTR